MKLSRFRMPVRVHSLANPQAGPTCFAVCPQFPQGSRRLRRMAQFTLESLPSCCERFHENDDGLVRPVKNEIPLYAAWKAASKPAELHIYSKGGHGFGVRKQARAAHTHGDRSYFIRLFHLHTILWFRANGWGFVFRSVLQCRTESKWGRGCDVCLA